MTASCYEVANIAWKKATQREISAAHARAIASAIGHYIPTLHPSSAVIERALEIALALKHPIYDCLYLACAQTVGGPSSPPIGVCGSRDGACSSRGDGEPVCRRAA